MTVKKKNIFLCLEPMTPHQDEPMNVEKRLLEDLNDYGLVDKIF